MNPLGLHPAFLLPFLFNMLVLVSWIVFAIVALRRLRDASLCDVARVIWAIYIVVVPIGGAVAHVVVQPGVASTERAPSLTSGTVRNRGENGVA